MAADLCGYKLALVASFKIKFLLNFKLKNEASRANLNKNKRIFKWRPFWNKVYRSSDFVLTFLVTRPLLANSACAVKLLEECGTLVSHPASSHGDCVS